MKKNLISLLSTIALVYVVFGVLLFTMQRTLLYFPTPKANHGFDEITFQNEGESITVLSLNKKLNKAPNKGMGAVIYFGGNGETVGLSATYFAHLYPEHTVYLVNYRGYGGSSGLPTEQGLYSDALFIYDRIKPQVSRVSVIGRSLGTGIATYVAANREVHKLVLVTPFDSIVNVAQKRFLFYPAFLMLKDKYDSVSRVPQIYAETLVLIAEYDEVIPNQHTVNLVNAFPASQIKVVSITNTGHNDISADPRYSDLLRDFIGGFE
jgi:hypothetical protein